MTTGQGTGAKKLMLIKTLRQIAAILHSPQPANEALVSSFSVDSRTIGVGALFFALEGERSDGHDYLEQAAAAGAVAAVVSRKYRGRCSALPLLAVDCPLAALQRLASCYLSETCAAVVAVTGSVGKTTTKEFIAALLSGSKRIFATPGNANSQVGLPLAILNQMKGDEQVVVLEMGMTHAGQIASLVKVAPPQIAIVTAVELVHAQNFSTLEDIARAKAEIFSSLHTRLAVIPWDSSSFPLLAAAVGNGCSTLSYSLKENSLADVRMSAAAAAMAVRWGAESATLPMLPLLGAHNRHNFLAAAIAARSLGLSWADIGGKVGTLRLVPKRLEQVMIKGVLFINDSYNACEASVVAGLTALPLAQSGGKRLAVLGEMLELGPFSERCHTAVGECALLHVDHLLCYGAATLPMVECWKQAGRQAVWSEQLDELVAALQCTALPGDVVFVKGSSSKRMWRILELF